MTRRYLSDCVAEKNKGQSDEHEFSDHEGGQHLTKELKFIISIVFELMIIIT